MPCHVAVSVRTTFLHRNLTRRRSPEAADFELSAKWSGIAIPQVEIESGPRVVDHGWVRGCRVDSWRLLAERGVSPVVVVVRASSR